MPGTSAGDNLNGSQSADECLIQACGADVDALAVGTNQRVEGVSHGARLLVDFLYHKVLVSTSFRCLVVPGYCGELLLDLLAFAVVEADFASLDAGHFAVSDIIHVPRVLQYCRDVGGNESLAFAGADDHRAVLARCPDPVREVVEQQCKGIGTPDSQHHLGKCGNRVAGLAVVIVGKFNCYFRICLRIKLISCFNQFVLEFLVILYDSVVNPDYGAVVRTGPGDMRVCIGLARLSVSRPACMTYANVPGQCLAPVNLLGQHPEPPLCLYNPDLSVKTPYGNAGRVVTTVFEF